jgi:hypothetical protein
MNNLFTRDCEEAKADEAIQTLSLRLTGLLRFARNDDETSNTN